MQAALQRQIQQLQVELLAALQQQYEQDKAGLLADLQQQHERYEAILLDALQQQHKQYEANFLATVQKQNQQQQSVQNTALERRELELLRTARAQDGEMSRDLKARLDSLMTTGGALRERVWARGVITADHDEREGVAGETGIKLDDAAEATAPTTGAGF